MFYDYQKGHSIGLSSTVFHSSINRWLFPIDSENSILILFILFYPLRVLAINNTNKESLDMSTRSIAKIVTANEQAEGAGARVRRSIGIMNQEILIHS